MGTCCGSDEESSQDRAVNKELTGGMKEDALIKKLLFLGSGGSGKSTLFKQLRSIHGKGFLTKDRIGFTDHIYSQIIGQMKTMLEFYDLLQEDQPEDFDLLTLSEDAKQAAEYIDYIRGDRDVNDEVAINVQTLWQEPAISNIWDNRAKLKIDFADSTAYFFDEVMRIANSQYVPSDQDILLVRHRTTGVIEQKFGIRGTSFHIFDVGGQKSERKKWIHCFEHVTAVIFVASLSCYDEVMYEDDTKNAMEDSITLFEDICNQRWFLQTAMILFLNKRDLFADKIQTVPITVCFDDYEGDPKSYDQC